MNKRLLILAMLALLSACGFELRKDPQLQFKTMALTGFKAKSLLGVELRRQISRGTVQIMDDENRAEVVLEADRDSQDKTVVVSTSAGQVREYQLNLHIDYVLRRPDGEVLLQRQELDITREMTYTESQALAKEQEEAALFRAMRSDAVNQIMRRLAAVRLPAN